MRSDVDMINCRDDAAQSVRFAHERGSMLRRQVSRFALTIVAATAALATSVPSAHAAETETHDIPESSSGGVYQELFSRVDHEGEDCGRC